MEEISGVGEISSLLSRLTEKFKNMEGDRNGKNVTDDDLYMVRESNTEGNTNSYANILNSEKVQPKVNFRKIDATL